MRWESYIFALLNFSCAWCPISCAWCIIAFARCFVLFDLYESTLIKVLPVKTFCERTSDSLNEGLPIKMTREKFRRK